MCFVLPRTSFGLGQDLVEVVFLVKYHYFYKTGRCEKKKKTFAS